MRLVSDDCTGEASAAVPIGFKKQPPPNSETQGGDKDNDQI